MFTTQHFDNEERYLESIGFPLLAGHKLIHADLLAKFGEHTAEFQRTGELSGRFFDFLRDWVAAHIKGVDVVYGHYVEERESA